ncbi:hypothetical protein RFI_15840 [Reticulomyxa filosa]|uniref:Uncharacterized protein n=1 Tax=Reticulomyxa filosa TaxID=46433 RepID=X6N531_RETFI|nr:hypothetical protein RFI_15840 [Reticulomyxa filosa]|eukprot:ETO21365.1 hypothetical protein RFI_15840 [Reticulomyxa filosa]
MDVSDSSDNQTTEDQENDRKSSEKKDVAMLGKEWSNVALTDEQIDRYIVQVFDLSNEDSSTNDKEWSWYTLQDVETIVIDQMFRNSNQFGWLFEKKKKVIEKGNNNNNNNDNKSEQDHTNQTTMTTSQVQNHILSIVWRYMFFCIVRPQIMTTNVLLFIKPFSSSAKLSEKGSERGGEEGNIAFFFFFL